MVNRIDHAQSGAVMAFRILDKLGFDPDETATIVTAIGNHDEGTAFPVNAVAAALIPVSYTHLDVYTRQDSAWLALGFDETHFREDFPTEEYYGNRPYQTDSATYKDFAALYEAMPEDQPRFGFLVSIQSHGDYDMNDASLDLVHAATDYGEYDDEVDEYLSCMYMSDQAITERCYYFTKVYEESGRRVIVALAGDHAPSFVDHIADKTKAAENDLQILERSTPYFIWANYPLENAGYVDVYKRQVQAIPPKRCWMMPPTSGWPWDCMTGMP